MEQYYVVRAEALPEIFRKVAQAKQLLETSKATTINEATRQTGISRSAFYKYRDMIQPLRNMLAGRILTFQMTLQDEAGLLSTVLSIFAQNGANILTIHQTIPTGGYAGVTISADTAGMACPVELLLQQLQQTEGVIRAELLAG